MKPNLKEGGKVLEWPTSGMSDQEKIAEAVAIADARREGIPYETKSGVNLGAIAAYEAPPREKKSWQKPKPKKKPRKSPKKRSLPSKSRSASR